MQVKKKSGAGSAPSAHYREGKRIGIGLLSRTGTPTDCSDALGRRPKSLPDHARDQSLSSGVEIFMEGESAILRITPVLSQVAQAVDIHPLHVVSGCPHRPLACVSSFGCKIAHPSLACLVRAVLPFLMVGIGVLFLVPLLSPCPPLHPEAFGISEMRTDPRFPVPGAWPPRRSKAFFGETLCSSLRQKPFIGRGRFIIQEGTFAIAQSKKLCARQSGASNSGDAASKRGDRCQVSACDHSPPREGGRW